MNKESTSSGVGILTVLQIVFIVLKLTNLISWPWPTVLIPLWVDLGIGALAGLFALILWLSRKLHRRNHR